MEEIRTLGALSLNDGATLPPFDDKRFKECVKRGDKYFCGAPLFFSNPLRDASPGVPMDTAQIENYRDHHFTDVDNITRLPHIETGCEPGGADMYAHCQPNPCMH